MAKLNPSELSDAQLKELRLALETKLKSLNSDVRDLEAEIKEEGSDGKDASDVVDRSSFEEEMQRMQLVLDGKIRLRDEVQYALHKFEEGTYGVCEESEEPIGYARLKATPWSRFSIESQTDLERKKKNLSSFHHGGAFPSAYDSPSGGGGSGGEE